MSEEVSEERARLVRRAEVVQSRLLRSVDALAHRKLVHGAMQVVVDKPTRQRLERRARNIALAIGGGLLAIALALVVKRARRRLLTS